MKNKVNEKAIVVKDVHKYFKVYYDRANTLKERVIFWKKEMIRSCIMY